MPLSQKPILATAVVLGVAITAVGASAQDLTYRPLSPSFGGDPFVGNFLLSTAEIDRPPEPSRSFGSFTRPDPIDQFADGLERRLLSRLSSEITDQIFGEEAADSGSFTVGDAQLEFERIGETVKIDLTNLESGQITTIELPVPQF